MLRPRPSPLFRWAAASSSSSSTSFQRHGILQCAQCAGMTRYVHVVAKNAKTKTRRRHWYSLTGTGGPGPLVTAHTTQTPQQHVIRTDLPRLMGGTDTAPQPVELLLGALMGCTQATVLFVARRVIVLPQEHIQQCSFALRAERDPRGALALDDTATTVPSRVQRVTGTVTLHLRSPSLVSPTVLQQLQNETERRCPIANMMIASGCQMDVEWRQVVYQQAEDTSNSTQQHTNNEASATNGTNETKRCGIRVTD